MNELTTVPAKHVFDLAGDVLEHNLGTQDYLVQIHDIKTGLVVTDWRIYKGPDTVAFEYCQRFGNVFGSWSEWRRYYAPAGKYRAVIIV